MDDLLVFTKHQPGDTIHTIYERHLKQLRTVLARCRKHNIAINHKKCSFLRTSFKDLGFLVTPKGIRPLPKKIAAIQKLMPPTTRKGVLRFLGMINFYKRFIPLKSDIAAPLTRLTSKSTKFSWTKECQTAFEAIKRILSKPVSYTHLTLPTNREV